LASRAPAFLHTAKLPIGRRRDFQQVNTATVAIARIAAAAPIDPSHSPGGAEVHLRLTRLPWPYILNDSIDRVK